MPQKGISTTAEVSFVCWVCSENEEEHEAQTQMAIAASLHDVTTAAMVRPPSMPPSSSMTSGGYASGAPAAAAAAAASLEPLKDAVCRAIEEQQRSAKDHMMDGWADAWLRHVCVHVIHLQHGACLWRGAGAALDHHGADQRAQRGHSGTHRSHARAHRHVQRWQ